MKRRFLAWVLIVLLAASGCGGLGSGGAENETGASRGMSPDEMKRIDLYAAVLKAAFEVGNGGYGFLAVKMDSLEGLSPEGKQEVLARLANLSEDIYPFDEVKDDPFRFEQDDRGDLVRSFDGTLLSVRVKKWSQNRAIIEGVSWFGNLGAYFPTYEAVWKDGAWRLELISMAVS